MIGVTSDSVLFAETKSALAALGTQVSLAMEGIALAEDLLRRKSEARFRSLVQNSSDVIMIAEADGTVRYVSPSVERILGYKPEDLIGTNGWEFTHPDELQKLRDLHIEVVDNPGPAPTIELRVRHRDGSWLYIEETGNNLLDDPNVGGFVFNIRDITERKQAEEELRKCEARNRAILDATPDLMFRVSREGEYLDFHANEDSKRYVPREGVVGKNLRDMMPPELVAPMLRRIVKTLDTREMQVIEYQLPVAGGELDFEARFVVSGPEEVLSVVRDVTERKTLERQLEHLAFHDALTGLPNRALFMDRLEHALTRVGRPEDSVAVLFMDLDNFKYVNDSLGHEIGDRLLVAVAERLRTCLRPQDTLARLGGDEFVILLEDVKGIGDATGAVERTAEVLRDPFALEGQEVIVTASVGISFGRSAREQPGGLLRSADLAMNRAKEAGKARYEVFDPDMNERVLERLRLESELRRALERDELRVYYQPKVLLNTNPQQYLGSKNNTANRCAEGELRAASSRRDRGAGALGASRARAGLSGPLHPDRGGERADHPHRTVGAGGSLPPGAGMAGTISRRSTPRGLREPLCETVPASRAGPRRFPDPPKDRT